jgi:hypothetical protein
MKNHEYHQANGISSWLLPALKKFAAPLLLALAAILLIIFAGRSLEGRLFGISFVGFILSLAWIDTQFERQIKVRPWSELAARTGLACHVRGMFLGSSVYVNGTYRERKLNLYTTRQGKGQVQSTRIELGISNPTGASLRMRGPFKRKETFDKVTSNLFATTEARQFGQDQSFFVRSRPIHLATALHANRPLWDSLLDLQALTNIELDENRLLFEQLGVLTDVDQLHRLCDLLSDIADTLEQRRLLEPGFVGPGGHLSMAHR